MADAFKLICVVGAPRSGTTLLQNLISSHPDVATSPETALFIHLADYGCYERNLPPVFLKSVRETWSAREASGFIAHLKTEMPWMNDYTEPEWPQTPIPVQDLAEAILKGLVAGSPKYVLEKTPPHVHFIPVIRRIFPEAMIVHIVRDPRDVASSYRTMLELQGKPTRSAYECAMVWRSSVRTAKKYNLPEVRFEDLLVDPLGTVQSLMKASGLQYTPEMIEQQHVVAQSSVVEAESWKENNASPVQANKTGAYKDKLSSPDIALIEKMCGKEMKAYGYTPDQPELDRRQLLAESGRYWAMRGRAFRTSLSVVFKKRVR